MNFLCGLCVSAVMVTYISLRVSEIGGARQSKFENYSRGVIRKRGLYFSLTSYLPFGAMSPMLRLFRHRIWVSARLVVHRTVQICDSIRGIREIRGLLCFWFFAAGPYQPQPRIARIGRIARIKDSIYRVTGYVFTQSREEASPECYRESGTSFSESNKFRSYFGASLTGVIRRCPQRRSDLSFFALSPLLASRSGLTMTSEYSG